MPSFYLNSFVGVKDGTKFPADRQDGRKVGAKGSYIRGSKTAAQAWANGDLIFLGTVRAGESIRNITVNTDTTLGTTTMTIGTLGTPAKYANAVTNTVLDRPVSIGPRATAADDEPLTADEDIWMTLGVGGIAGGINVTFEIELASVK